MINLTETQKQQLENMLEAGPEPICRRCIVILAYAAGQPTREAAAQASISRGRARYWRRQFQLYGMDIFKSRRALLEPPPAPVDTQEQPSVVDETPLPVEAKPEILFAPRKHPGLVASDPMAEAGRKALAYHFGIMLRHEDGTRLGEDIEELHDMRVASRRMRAAFELFADAFDPQVLRRHLKGLRATGRALGRVRDLDVFIEKGRAYAASLPEDQQSGLEPLIEAWQSQRQEARQEMLAYLNSQKYQDFKRKFAAFLQSSGAGAVEGHPELGQPRVCEAAPTLIYTRYGTLRAYEKLFASATLDQLHQMRIEVKKLRYALEFFDEVLGSDNKTVIQKLKALQDHLGNLNDARVACDLVADFLQSWESRQVALPLAERRNPQPVVQYLADMHAERHRLLVTFPSAWAAFNTPENRRLLALAVSAL